jgi:hypothetical protein
MAQVCRQRSHAGGAKKRLPSGALQVGPEVARSVRRANTLVQSMLTSGSLGVSLTSSVVHHGGPAWCRWPDRRHPYRPTSAILNSLVYRLTSSEPIHLCNPD